MSDRGNARAPWPLLLLALIPLLLPFHVSRAFLSDDAIIYGYDHAQLQYPRYAILCAALQDEGSFPLWQRPLNAGGPFHANPETPTLYPPVLLLAAFLPPVLVMNLTIVLHLSLAGLGMFLLVRRLWRRVGGGEAEGAVGALLAALVFGSCHYTRMEHWNLVAYGAAHALIPWILLATDAVLHGTAPRRATGLLALLLAAQVFTGGLYVYAYTALGLLLWIGVECLGGGPDVRRRALRWGLLVALVATLLVAAKLAPFPHWAANSSRSGPLAPDMLTGKTLGGHGSIDWPEVARATGLRTGGWAVLLLPLALPLLRWSAVRAALLVLILGFFAALDGPVHTALTALPPFDRIRNAERAWTLVNAMLPVLAGLGLAWLLSRLGGARAGRSSAIGTAARGSVRRVVALSCGVAAALLILPSLLASGQYTADLAHPFSLRQVLASRYPHWQDVARRQRDERAMQVDARSPAGRNEQFVATALGLEIVAGLLGNSWPAALGRHAYSGGSGPLWPELRRRRLGVLAVAWLVSGGRSGFPHESPVGAASHAGQQAFPSGIDGTEVVGNPWARPRALQPAAVVGVFGDRAAEVEYALLDLPVFPLLDASVVHFGPDAPPTEGELAALDEIVIVQAGEPIAPDVAALLDAAERSRPDHVQRVAVPLGADSQSLLSALARRLAERGAGRALQVSRPTSGKLLLVRESASLHPARGGWAVLAETFALHGGWDVSVDGRPARFRRADGVASAVLLPAGATTLRAHYAPSDVRLGWVLGAAGLLLAARLLFRGRAHETGR